MSCFFAHVHVCIKLPCVDLTCNSLLITLILSSISFSNSDVDMFHCYSIKWIQHCTKYTSYVVCSTLQCMQLFFQAYVDLYTVISANNSVYRALRKRLFSIDIRRNKLLLYLMISKLTCICLSHAYTPTPLIHIHEFPSCTH